METNDQTVLIYLTEQTETTDDFPSNFGGYPSWLYQTEITNNINCNICKTTKLTFLGQLYSPLDYEQSYHRVIYIFFCENQACKNKNDSIVIYRLQTIYTQTTPTPIIDKNYNILDQTYSIYTQVKSTDQLKHLIRKVKKDILQNLQDDDDEQSDPQLQNSKLETIRNTFVDKEAQIQQFQQNTKKKFDDPVFQIYKGVMEKLQHPFMLYGNYPIYFKSGGFNVSQKKCKSCKGQMMLEFQINSCVLSKFKRLLNFQWGVILVYTCKKSCKNKVVQQDYELQIEQEAQMTKQQLEQELQKLKKQVTKKQKRRQKKKQKKKIKQQKQKQKIQKQIQKQEQGGQWD